MQIEDTQLKLEQFFADYANRFQAALDGKPDYQGTADAFTDPFIGASPEGIAVADNDDKFVKTLEESYVYYTKSGMRSIRIGSLNMTPLDDLHWMVTVGWESMYEKPDGTDVPINFDVIYMVQWLKDSEPKIFASVSGDEQQALKDAGLSTAS
jgi:hypothetical protein